MKIKYGYGNEVLIEMANPVWGMRELEGFSGKYKGKEYIFTCTNRYWKVPGMGKVLEMRDSKTGKKLGEVGDREVEE